MTSNDVDGFLLSQGVQRVAQIIAYETCFKTLFISSVLFNYWKRSTMALKFGWSKVTK